MKSDEMAQNEAEAKDGASVERLKSKILRRGSKMKFFKSVRSWGVLGLLLALVVVVGYGQVPVPPQPSLATMSPLTYECFIDFTNNNSNCHNTPHDGTPDNPPRPDGTVVEAIGSIDWVNDRAVVKIDMGTGPKPPRKLEMTVRLAPSTGLVEGFLLNVGDSPTNGGGGGDAGQFSNDAELQITDDNVSPGIDVLTLRVYPNDSLLTPRPIALLPLFCAPGDTVEIVIKEMAPPRSSLSIRSLANTLTMVNDFLFSFDRPDTEGAPNHLFYAGLNRSIGDPARSGTGVIRVEFRIKREF